MIIDAYNHSWLFYYIRFFFNNPDDGRQLQDNNPLQIVSIRIISGCLNLGKQIRAIVDLDNMLSNNVTGGFSSISAKSKHGSVISELMSKSKSLFHPYLYKTFQTFVTHKQKIKIDIKMIESFVDDQALIDLFFDTIEKKDMDDMSAWIDGNNLFKPAFFHVFKNIKEMHINVYAYDGIYQFSLSGFLEMIQNTAVNKVTIDFGGTRGREPLCALTCSSEFVAIRKEYKAERFRIKVDGYFEDKLVISKK